MGPHCRRGCPQRIDLTAFGFTRSEFREHVTIEEEEFLIDVDAVAIRVEVGVELDLADFIRYPVGWRWLPPGPASWGREGDDRSKRPPSRATSLTTRRSPGRAATTANRYGD